MLPAFGESDVAMLLSKLVFAIFVKTEDMIEILYRHKAAVRTTARDCRTRTHVRTLQSREAEVEDI